MFVCRWLVLANVMIVIMLLQQQLASWVTGIRRLMRGMATLPLGNQELLVVKDKVGRPQVSLG